MEHLSALCAHGPENLTVNNKVEIITNLILTAANQSIPKTANKGTKSRFPWWNEECKVCLLYTSRCV